MPTQGNSEPPVYPANSCNSVYVYVSTSCATVAIGCTLYYDSARTITMPAGTYKIDYADDNHWKFTVDASGVVTAVTRCVWYSSQIYSELWTGVKNDCVVGSCTVVGSTITLNDNGNNVYTTGGSYTSYVSQLDADSQAYTIAFNAFQAGKQGKVNEYGSCTWTYNSGSAAAGAYCQTYTRNNCAANCDAGTYQTCSTAKSGYSAVSTVSCNDAVTTANNAAYTAAVNEVQAAGQTNANNNATCCCWVAASTAEKCSGCNYSGNLEKNQCTGAFRNTGVTATSSCTCDQSCAGTYWYYYCDGTTRMRESRYNCSGNYAGTRETVLTCDTTNCGAITSPYYEYQNYTTCYNCTNSNVYKDTRGTCSGTNGQYYVYYNGSYVYVGGQPSGVGCNYTSSCVDSGNAYCSGSNYVINRTQTNGCSGESCSVRVIEYNSVTYGCYDPCAGNTSPAYTSQGYTTCYSCSDAEVFRDTNSCSSTYNSYYVGYGGYTLVGGGQPTGGSCNTSSNCVDSGSAYCSGSNWVINQTQANPCSQAGCGVRVIEYNSQGNGCYTPPPACKIYEVFMYGSNPEYVYFHYQDCYGGGQVYTSTYNDGGGGSGGTFCVIPGTAYIDSGTAQFTDTGSSCGNT